MTNFWRLTVAALVAAGSGAIVLVPLAGLVGPFEREVSRVLTATAVCFVGGLAAALWALVVPKQWRGLADVAGGLVREVSCLASLGIVAALAGWLVSVSTLLYSVLIYSLTVALQTLAVLPQLSVKNGKTYSAVESVDSSPEAQGH